MQGSSSGCDYSNGDAGSASATAPTTTGNEQRSTAAAAAARHQFLLNSNLNLKRSATDAGLTMTSSTGLTSDEDDDDDADDVDCSPPPVGKIKVPPANGKKTKGRVKIKMEFIDNKLRRYTTFSKRKTGIMKKAYELSTLTGTQVMLLVASETGHVYTFATRKLQPMITSEAGKALIQTCLNSPDPLLNCGSSNNGNNSINGHNNNNGGGSDGAGMCGGSGGILGGGGGGGGGSCGGGDQRMSATGFEETEFTYSINDDEQKVDLASSKSHGPFSGVGLTTSNSLDSAGSASQSPTLTDLSTAATTVSESTLFNPAPVNNDSVGSGKPSPLTVKTVQIPSSATTFSITSGQASAGLQSTAAITSTQNNVMMVPSSHQALSMIKGSLVNVAAAVTTTAASSMPGAVMYQTPQGFIYATPTTTALPEGVLFNFGQLQQQAGASSSAQQYITIPLSFPASQIVQGVNLDGRSAAKNIVTDLSKGGAKK